MAMTAAKPRLAAYPLVSLANDPLDAVEDADALLIVTEWAQFRRVDWMEVRERMRKLHVYDGRNICEPEKMAALGFVYRGIGRASTERIAVTEGFEVTRSRDDAVRAAFRALSSDTERGFAAKG
jgi:UDPglucose 6-dehydrogenase